MKKEKTEKKIFAKQKIIISRRKINQNIFVELFLQIAQV